MYTKITASDAYELLTSKKQGATLYHDSESDEVVVSSNVPSAWHETYTLIASREAAIAWMAEDFQGNENAPTDTDCEILADWLSDQSLEASNDRT